MQLPKYAAICVALTIPGCASGASTCSSNEAVTSIKQVWEKKLQEPMTAEITDISKTRIEVDGIRTMRTFERSSLCRAEVRLILAPTGFLKEALEKQGKFAAPIERHEIEYDATLSDDGKRVYVDVKTAKGLQ